MCKNLILGPAKLIEVSLEGYFKDSITRKRWLGDLLGICKILKIRPQMVVGKISPFSNSFDRWLAGYNEISLKIPPGGLD